MLGLFSKAFAGTFLAELNVFIVILAAGLLVRRKVITQAHINGLSTATIVVFLPCLIFANVIKNLDPGKLPYWWALPLAGLAMSLVGMAFGGLAFWRELPAKLNMLPLTSIPNASYLVLPLGLQLYPDRFDTFALYCFLFLLGVNPFLWSVGKLLATSGTGDSTLSWRGLVTPPMVANLSAITLVLLKIHRVIPHVVINAVNLLGTATVPVATFVLGAVLGSINIRIRPFLVDAIRINLIKLFIVPLMTFLVLYFYHLEVGNLLLSNFLIIEAAVPPATNIILQVRGYGGDEQKIGSLMLVTYVLSVLTLPLWISVWSVLAGR